MNKLQLTVLYIVFSTAPVGLAMASPLLGAATPVQSYQSAQSSSQADKQINSSSEFDKVKQIMAKAKQEVQEGKVAPISQLKVPVTT
ncbi:MAG: hypothetical protein KDH94_05205, partial [Coxiellaceae bacterium]|nr:hypothetical protein [Coxiellaceae bacterium]